MKFSEQWLREWVNPTVSREQLVHKLTMAGLEVEAVTPVAGDFTAYASVYQSSTNRILKQIVCNLYCGCG